MGKQETCARYKKGGMISLFYSQVFYGSKSFDLRRKGEDDGLDYFYLGSHRFGPGGLLQDGILGLPIDCGFVVH